MISIENLHFATSKQNLEQTIKIEMEQLYGEFGPCGYLDFLQDALEMAEVAESLYDLQILEDWVSGFALDPESESRLVVLKVLASK